MASSEAYASTSPVFPGSLRSRDIVNRRSFAGPALSRGVVFNGKFLSGPARGLNRVGTEMIKAIDDLLAECQPSFGGRTWEVVCRPDAADRLQLKNIQVRRLGGASWPLWEQVELPRLLQGKQLVNLCNMSPLSVKGAITFIHDAHVFIMPQSHTRGYAAWYRFALPRVARRASRVVTVSQFSRQALIDYDVVEPERIEVIANGGEHLLRATADPGILDRLGIEPGRYVLALANTQLHKNIGVLLKAWSEQDMKLQTLVLVGPHGPAAFAAAGHTIPDGVKFAGNVEDGELRALYEAATCYACPSLLEGFGLPAVEAMTLGCPVVASPRAALPEVCREAALYADPYRPEAWRQAIDECRLPDRRCDLQARGIRQAARFSWRAAASALMRLIEQTAPATSQTADHEAAA